MTSMTKFMARAISFGIALAGVLGYAIDPASPAPLILVIISVVLFVAGYEKPQDEVH